jgi:hypothetical protein
LLTGNEKILCFFKGLKTVSTMENSVSASANSKKARATVTAALLLSFALSLVPPFLAHGQSTPEPAPDDLRVLPAVVDGVAPEALVETQLKKLAYAALDRRDAAYEQLKTPDELAAWQKRERENFLAALGGFPERTPLNARVAGARDFGDYRMEKILFESQPGFFVSGLLYLPAGAGPHPAVLMPCGHTGIAKAGELYQRAAISMATAGIAAFCYDPIGQGERREFLKADGAPEFPSTTDEHQLIGVSAMLVGSSLARTMIWDAMRALDYLQSRPDMLGSWRFPAKTSPIRAIAAERAIPHSLVQSLEKPDIAFEFT